MPLPVARTRDEAHLYMDLHPCHVCDHSDVLWEAGLASDEGAPARRYSGTCSGCGIGREFVFRLPPYPVVPRPGEVVTFGGPECSELLDAGEWLYVADVCARAAAGTEAGPPTAGSFGPFGPGGAGGDPTALNREARESLLVAIAAIEEILKFVPVGQDEVPRGAFWSERGRRLRQSEPGRFRRRRLAVVRDRYRDVLARAAS
jgi:hypothetical protein